MPKGHRPCPRYVMEPYTDPKTGKTKYRRKVCPICGGSGWTS